MLIQQSGPLPNSSLCTAWPTYITGTSLSAHSSLGAAGGRTVVDRLAASRSLCPVARPDHMQPSRTRQIRPFRLTSSLGARRATCSAARSSVTLRCSPPNMPSIFSFSCAFLDRDSSSCRQDTGCSGQDLPGMGETETQPMDGQLVQQGDVAVSVDVRVTPGECLNLACGWGVALAGALRQC